MGGGKGWVKWGGLRGGLRGELMGVFDFISSMPLKCTCDEYKCVRDSKEEIVGMNLGLLLFVFSCSFSLKFVVAVELL